ncbi:hypothetical protein JOD24_001669 [Kroppenstedtia sanguinis]|uniref:Uncharacterized protein n=1 Tax=Kroppenstedtia sanguinis TaxID=1380684 RepID=A0ABW4CES9_9BACL
MSQIQKQIIPPLIRKFLKPGVLISYILDGEIVFTHATVAIRQGSENWPLQIFRSGRGKALRKQHREECCP